MEAKRNRPQRLNNPHNLRYAGQREAIGADKDEFAIFPTAEAGARAGLKEIELACKRGQTIFEFITEQAPPSENLTEKYIKFICDELRVGQFFLVSELSHYALWGVIAKYEGWFDKNI